MEIVISGNRESALDLVKKLSEELGLHVRELSPEEEEANQKKRSERLYQLMEEMAKSNAFESIKDPVAWQREIRKDRPLPGRD